MRTRALFAAALVTFIARIAGAADYAGLAIFGDSLSDTGNIYAWSFQTTPDPDEYWNNRFTNGPNWVDQLGARLGVAGAQSYFDESSPTFTTNGYNYAFGGAHTDVHVPELEAGFTLLGSLIGQPQLGLLGRWGMTSQVATHVARNQPRPDYLHILWGGANDVFDGQNNVWTMAGNTAGNIASLYLNAGAREFLIPNLPPLGRVPNYLQNGVPKYAPFSDYIDQLCADYNAALDVALDHLETLLPEANFRRLDIASLFGDFMTDPSAYGITNTTASGMGKPGGENYLFWDSVHPTSKVHGLIAEAAFQLLSSPSTAAIPEPSAVSLLALAFVAMRRKPRR